MAGETAPVAPAATEVASNVANQGNIETKGEVNTEGMTKTEARKEIERMLKVKVDGQEIEKPESEVVRGYSHQQAANKRMQEALKTQREYAQRVQEFNEAVKDPSKMFAYLEGLGYNLDELSEQRIMTKLQRESLDPKEKALLERDAEIARREAKVKAWEEEQEKAREEERKKYYLEEYNKQFTEALEQTGLPIDKSTVKEMARYIKMMAVKGIKITAHEAAQLVKGDLERTNKAIIPKLSVEQLATLLGDEQLDKIRQFQMSKIKTPEQMLKTPGVLEQGERSDRSERKRKGPMSAQEWRDFNRR